MQKTIFGILMQLQNTRSSVKNASALYSLQLHKLTTFMQVNARIHSQQRNCDKIQLFSFLSIRFNINSVAHGA